MEEILCIIFKGLKLKVIIFLRAEEGGRLEEKAGRMKERKGEWRRLERSDTD